MPNALYLFVVNFLEVRPTRRMKFSSLIILFLLSFFASQAQITGTGTVCVGGTTGMTGSGPVGSTWSSSNVSVATVSSTGIVTGVSSGTATISYGISPTYHTSIVTVNALPVITLFGSSSICIGSGTSLHGSPTMGTWSSSNTLIASVSTSGYVTGVTAGVVEITYTTTSGCSSSRPITVNPLPTTITGTLSICESASSALTSTPAGGTWIVATPSVATVGSATGIVNGVSSGTSSITYTLSTGCRTSGIVTVNPLPASISGAASLCTSISVTYGSTTTGGTWSSSSPSVVAIDATSGTANAITAGSSVISYTLPTGCNAVRAVTVYPTPAAIAGPASVCVGSTITLSNSVVGGVWTSSSPAIGSISSSVGSSTNLTGLAAGTCTVSYTIAGTCTATRIVTVEPLPVAGVLTGPGMMCTGTTSSAFSTVSGGSWTSSSIGIATIGSTSGVINAISAGTTTISYSVSNACGTAVATVNVTVSVPPSSISGPTSICDSSSGLFSCAVTGGIWSSSNIAVASIGSSTGMVVGNAPGTTIISYSIGSCAATDTLTVTPAPAGLTGIMSLCTGRSTTLADATTGGTWATSSTSIAVVTTVGSTTGVITGVSAGTATISYSIGGCIAYAVVTVSASPTVNVISSPLSCQDGTMLSVTGGDTYVWTPAAGLTCTSCTSVTAVPTVSTTYSVVATATSGCIGSTTTHVSADYISGNITFAAATPPLTTCEVYLIKYAPLDSSVLGIDTQTTCMSGSEVYYRFDMPTDGRYMVRARLTSGATGGNGYLPTYGANTPNWFNGASITHIAGRADRNNIELQYATLPSGPGFIAGNIYSGAAKGTAGEIPEQGVLVFIKDAATGLILSHTYTNASGGYVFGSLGLGNYVIYPAEFDYYTTPSSTVTLSSTSVFATDVTFKKNTTSHTIYPFTYVSVKDASDAGKLNEIVLSPNPATNWVKISGDNSHATRILITDITGKTVKELNLTEQPIDVSGLVSGTYLVMIYTEEGLMTKRLIKQ